MLRSDPARIPCIPAPCGLHPAHPALILSILPPSCRSCPKCPRFSSVSPCGLPGAELDQSGGCVYPASEPAQPVCVRFLSCPSAAVPADEAHILAAYQSGRMERIANPFAQALVGSNPTAAFGRVGRGREGRGKRAGRGGGVPKIFFCLPPLLWSSGPLRDPLLCLSPSPLPLPSPSSPRSLPSPLRELCVLFTQAPARARPRGNDRP